MSFFNNYRADQLGNVEAVGNTYRMQVTGDGSSATKWLNITGTELEKIIALLEPEAYKAAVDERTRVSFPDLTGPAPEIERPKTFAEAHEIIRSGRDRYRLQNEARQWLEDSGKGGAWAGTLEEILAALDRFYDTGSIGFVIDRS
jgi:hypothetical protein